MKHVKELERKYKNNKSKKKKEEKMKGTRESCWLKHFLGTRAVS